MAMWDDVSDEVLERGLSREPRSRRFLQRRKHRVTRKITEFGLTLEQHYREQIRGWKTHPKQAFMMEDVYGVTRKGRLVKLRNKSS